MHRSGGYVLLLLGVLALLAMQGCGGWKDRLAADPEPLTLRTPPPSMQELEAMLAEELAKLGKDAARIISAAPSDPENAVFDLQGVAGALEAGEAAPPTGVLLSWTERVVGDYDQNGEVNAADLAPLSKYWQQRVSYLDPAEAGVPYWPADESGAPAPLFSARWRVARVDGKPDTEINQADISPIAKHFQARISGYRVYRQGPEDAEPVALDGALFAQVAPEGHAELLTVPRAATFPPDTTRVSEDHGVHYFLFDQPPTAGTYEYFVAPVDAENEGLGTESLRFSVDFDAETALPLPGEHVELPLQANDPAGDAPFEVTLSFDSGTLDLALVVWDFDGDGLIDAASGRQHSASRVYDAPGYYDAAAYGLTPDGITAVARMEVAVLDNGNFLPRANLTLEPAEGLAPLTVTLDASGSSDVEGIESYEFDFDGDGEFDSGPIDTPLIQHVYDEGEYAPVVRITDTSGATDTATATLIVGPDPNQPPVAEITVLTETEGVYAPIPVTFELVGTDPEGSSVKLELDYTDNGEVDFTQEGQGSGVPRQTTRNYSAGTHTARLRVTDPKGLTGEATVTFTLLFNNPPVPVLTADVTSGPSPLTVTFDASGSSDPDGHTIEFNWDFPGIGGLGSPGSDIETFTYGVRGTRLARVTVTDEYGASATATVEIETTTGWSNTVVTAVEQGFQFNPGVGLVEVDGRPAVTYVREGAIHYQLAADADGTDWPPSEIIWSGPPLASDPTLELIDGWPTIAFNDWDGGVWFTRAQDALGTTWNAPVLVFMSSGVTAEIALAEIDGLPAIALLDSLNHLWYRRATDVDGTAWGTAHAFGKHGGYTFNQALGFTTIAGAPAISVSSGSTLSYYRAMDATGTMWSPAVVVYSHADLRQSSAMVEVAGTPTVLFQDVDGLWATAATDPGGSSWSLPTFVSLSRPPQGVTGARNIVLESILGQLTTVDANSGFFSSLDATGSAWEPRMGLFDFNVATDSVDLAEIDGTYGALVEVSSGLRFFIFR